MNSGSFKNVLYKVFIYKSLHALYMYKQNLALNYLQGLIWQPTNRKARELATDQ